MINIRPALRACVPLIVVETSDPQQTIDAINITIDGKKPKEADPIMRWDLIRSLVGLNEAGKKEADKLSEKNPDNLLEPSTCLKALSIAAEKSVTYFMNAHLLWNLEHVRQAVWNLRDYNKKRGATLIMLCPTAISLPDELKSDCIVLTDTLPSIEEIHHIVDDLVDVAKVKKLKADEREKASDALRGLSAFAAEQVAAMSITKEGLQFDELWERKRKMIEQTPGLSVWRGGEKFDTIGGYNNVKKFMKRVIDGKEAPRAVVFVDEIEKSMAGASSDTSGVSQDYLRALLTFMQDKRSSGVIFVGAPGSGKSAVAKATGNEAGIPTIALDLGGMKGSLVGQSEQRLRSALQVVDAVSQGATLFIATCNSVGILPPELKRRFTLGTFFFPLPSKADRRDIWNKYLKKFGFMSANGTTTQELPDDDGWTGAEIENCVTIAWRLKCSLVESAKYIVPVAVAAKDQIERLCRDASNRYIDASADGLYEHEKTEAEPTDTRRRINI